MDEEHGSLAKRGRPNSPPVLPPPGSSKTVDSNNKSESSGNPLSNGRNTGEGQSVFIQLKNKEGDLLGSKLDIPATATQTQLSQLINTLLKAPEDETVPYTFYISDDELTSNLHAHLCTRGISREQEVEVVYQPLERFHVRAVTRCTDTLEGHQGAVLHLNFSPDGKYLVSGGGDNLVRFWDVDTCAPLNDCKGHQDHVLATAWCPDGKKFATGDKRGKLLVWTPTSPKPLTTMRGHKKWVTAIVWEPMHRSHYTDSVSESDGHKQISGFCERFASASNDATVKIWNSRTGKCEVSMTAHQVSLVEC